MSAPSTMFSMGWYPVDPGPGPRSPLLDNPPAQTANAVADYLAWKRAVEQDENRLLQGHLQTPHWFPIPLPDDVHVVPVYGGTESAIESLVTTLVLSGVASGLAQSRVVNLSGWNLSRSLSVAMRSARRNHATFETISEHGSTVGLFSNPNPQLMISLLVDALRVSADKSGARQSQRERQELLRVVGKLNGAITLPRIIAAVDVALGTGSQSPLLSVHETRDLQDLYQAVVAQQSASQGRLSDLLLDLHTLASFDKSSRSGVTVGQGPKGTVKWFDVASGGSPAAVELAREVLARAMLQRFTATRSQELLVIVGAERLSDEVLDELVNTAQSRDHLLVLVYTYMNDAGKRMMGFAGSSLAVFLKLPNATDAEAAAGFIGKQYTFVVNGISIAEGATQDWSDSYGTTSSSGTSYNSSSSRTSGFSGGHFSFNRTVGSSVTRSFERGTSQTATAGGSSSTTSTTSAGRVHEYVVEPEVFQQMPDDAMMIIARSMVLTASCANQLRTSKLTSTSNVYQLP